MARILFLKAHVSGYTKRDGTYVRPYADSRRDASNYSNSSKIHPVDSKQEKPMRNVEQIRSELAAAQAAYDADQQKIKGLKQYDRVVNEGGDGFSSYEHESEKLFNEHAPRIKSLSDELFAAEWTPEVTAQRRATWNAEVSKLGAKVRPEALKALIGRLGYSHNDIARAKALHGM